MVPINMALSSLHDIFIVEGEEEEEEEEEKALAMCYSRRGRGSLVIPCAHG